MRRFSIGIIAAFLACTIGQSAFAAGEGKSLESRRIAAFALARESIDRLRVGDKDYELTIARMQRALRETGLSFADVRTSREEMAMYVESGARLRVEALLTELRTSDACTDPSAPSMLQEEFRRARMQFSELHFSVAELQKYERVCAPKYSTR